MCINHKSSRGFTLLEVAVAMSILALIAGCIFLVLRGTVEEASVLEQEQARQQQIDGFMELCRRTFRMLPAQATLEGRVRQDSGKALPEIIIRKAPESLAWGKVDDYDTINVIGLRPQIGGLFSLSLLRVSNLKDPAVDPVAVSKDEDWLTLIPDILQLDWRYFDSKAGIWQDLQPPGAARPSAIEMNLLLAGEDVPLRVVFWLVPVVQQQVVTTATKAPAPTPKP